MYLTKYLVYCCICSRRKAAEIVKKGNISVNGKVVYDVAFDIKDGDAVVYQKKVIRPKKFVYILLNKSKEYITTCSDERDRKTVMDLITGATSIRVYPVGRLDRTSTGLLLLTNNGKLAQKLSHPSSNIIKRYRVLLDKNFVKFDLQRLLCGVTLDDGFIKIDSVVWNKEKARKSLVVEIHSGKNRIIRRIFDYLGYKVKKLDRIYYAGLTKKRLFYGKWRFLTKDEIGMLQSL